MIIITIVTGLLLVVTLLPVLRNEAWWVRGWDFPRLQLAIFAVIILVADLVFLALSTYVGLGLLVVTFLCLVYQCWWILPYTFFYPKEVVRASKDDPSDKIRILASNVLTTNRKAKALLALIEENKPDIVVAVETDLWWQQQLDVLKEDYTYTLKCPLNNFYGMHVYSRLPLENTEIAFLVEDDKPSMHATVLLPSGKPIRVHFLHPGPPSPTENGESSERDAELVVVGKNVVEEDMGVIVTGDLNDVAWSATTRLFRKISGLLDPRVGRGMYNTFHADHWFLRWPLDHIFHSDHFTFSSLKVLPYIGSDHFPILIELVYHEARRKEQEGLEADGEDHKWAEEKMDSENVQKEDVPG